MLALLCMGIVFSPAIMPAASATSQVEVNDAIEKGLLYLNKTQVHKSVSEGYWGSFAPVACTAMAVLAFENAPNSHYGWKSSDPYNATVQSGLNWLFSQAKVIPIDSNKSAGNPDNNRNGFGIGWYGDSQPVYETPMVLMAIIASNAPTNVTIAGEPNVTGRTYRDVAQDIVDWLAWAQNSVVAVGKYEGGWRYQPQWIDSDNSISQWPVLGLMAAELWSINAPGWVRSELMKWITTMQNLNSTSPVYGAFDYQPGRGLDTPADTAAGILELTYCGVNETDSRIIAAEGYLNRDWNPNGTCPNGDDYGWNWNIGDLYDMYAVMKACRLTTPIPARFIANYDGTPGVEWYNGTGEYVDALLNVTNHHSDGTWANWVPVAEGEQVPTVLSTAWGVLILEYVPVKVLYNLSVHVVAASANSPIAGANVTIEGQMTDSSIADGGTAVFNQIQAGIYNMSVSKAGYGSASVTVSLTNDTQVTIYLASLTRMLAVHVVDADTNGFISEANVVVVGPESRSGVTEGETVVFENIQAGEYSVTASKTGYSSASMSVSLTTGAEVTVRLTPSTSEQVPSNVLLWIIAVTVASGVIMAMGFAIILMAAADRIRRRRKKKYALISRPKQKS